METTNTLYVELKTTKVNEFKAQIKLDSGVSLIFIGQKFHDKSSLHVHLVKILKIISDLRCSVQKEILLISELTAL